MVTHDEHMTEAELLGLIAIAKMWMAITSDLSARANLRVFIGECTGRIHRIRQRRGVSA